MDTIDRATVTRFLTAVGDPLRLQLLFVLKGARMNVGDIAAQLPISRPAVSHHLKVLRDAGVLQSQKLGQEVFYWVDKPHLVGALRDLAATLERYIDD